MKEYIMLLDTETVSKSKYSMQNYVFDYGCCILEKDEEKIKIVDKYNLIVKEIYDNKELMDNYYFGQEKLQTFYVNNEKNLTFCNFSTLNKFINKICNKYNINKIAAYNITFDIKSFQNTCDLLGAENALANKECIDLYNKACHALQGDENYIVYCVENDQLTEKGNIKSNAESVYGYINHNPNFVESHTALDDCLIETEIYKWVLQKEKEEGTFYEESPSMSAWRLVQVRKKK